MSPMKTNPIKQGILTECSTVMVIATRKMVRERAVELAVINGHAAQEVSKSDWEQAKREMTGGWDVNSKEALLESVPESERWNPVSGSTGHKMPVTASDDEDSEGRSYNERLVGEGIAQAEADHLLAAVREAAKKDKL